MALKKTKSGFVAVVAIGIFALLTIFGILIQIKVINSSESIKNANDSFAAKLLSNSTLDYARSLVSAHDYGYSNSQTCEYKAGSLINSTYTAFCSDFASMVAGQDAKISLKVTGRNETPLKTSTCPGGTISKCFTVPAPATGNAGSRCDQYRPSEDTDTYVDQTLIGSTTITNLDHAEYSCNWSKLSFGSNVTDRVAIPLYYEKTDGTIANPYKDKTATKFALRLRTPCLPCVYDTKDLKTGQNRLCTTTQDPTVCKPTDRYTLSTTESDSVPNDIVVQWQLTGLCDGEECSMVAWEDGNEKTQLDSDVETSLWESEINKYANSLLNQLLFKGKQQGFDTSKNSPFVVMYKTAQAPNPFLLQLEKGLFTLFLNGKLKTSDGQNIPYLEYQLITDSPIANAKTLVETVIEINNIRLKENLAIENETPLIDFAIQN